MDGRLLVLYDGDCGTCTWLAGLIARRDDIDVAPILSADGERLLRDLSLEARLDSVHVVDAAGRRLSAGAALPALARRLPGGRLLGPLLEAFPQVTEHGYRAVAARRGTLLPRIRRRVDTLARRC